MGLIRSDGLRVVMFGLPVTDSRLAAPPRPPLIPLTPAKAGAQIVWRRPLALIHNASPADPEPYDLGPGLRRDERIMFGD